MAFYTRDREYDDMDLRADAAAERRQRARMNHFCSDCHGRSGGPCSFGEGEEPTTTDVDEEDSNG